jgi:hypothetical protein
VLQGDSALETRFTVVRQYDNNYRVMFLP